MRRIGVDTGGTFTDCVLIDYASNEVVIAKVPSRPDEPQGAILDGVQLLPHDGGDAAVESVVHGTTIATNAVITNDFARVGFITTPGFRDVLEIGTQQRPQLYDLRQSPRPSLVPRQLRMEVDGRIAANGEEIEPLDAAQIEAVAEGLVEAGVEAIAIACLFSFVNPAHEREIQQIVQARAPSLYVGRSSSISQEPREYPRFATAAVNAALAPKIDPYVRTLEQRLATQARPTRLYVMQSNGGVGTADRSVGENVHQLILSGPAAGVIGGAREAAACGFRSCVTFDVGGTSADIGVVNDGEPRSSFEMTLPNGVPCKLPHIEVETIGAGGGSIAGVDAGGALHVGPQSAGADPGPACYGRSGTEPTVTDAHLLLGRLSPSGLIGGNLALDAGLAEAALAGLGRRLGAATEEMALGVLALLEANMAGAIRQAAARHGDDLRDYVLVAGGGAGPLHAASLIRQLGMPAAVVPPHPGMLSALGLLVADIRHDLVAPVLGVEGAIAEEDVERTFAGLELEAAATLADDDVPPAAQRLERSLDLRYLGQEYALAVPTMPDEPLAAVVERFHQLHERTFGHSAPAVTTEIVSARLAALGLREAPDLQRELPQRQAAPLAHRQVLFDASSGRSEAAIYQREQLARGQVVEGPAVVEQLDTTTVVPPRFRAEVHPSGSLIVTATEEAA